MSTGNKIHDVSEYVLFMARLEEAYWSGKISYLGFICVRRMIELGYPQYASMSSVEE